MFWWRMWRHTISSFQEVWKTWIFGAPCQLQYPYFCLVSVHCPHFVLFLSRFCLNFVPFLSCVPLLSPFCLQILSFVLFWTRFCPIFVPIWSSQSMANGADKYWTKLELNHFSIFNLVTLQQDKNGTKIGHLSQICPLFVHAPYSFHNCLYFCTWAGQKWDNSETPVLHLSSFCPHTLLILQLSLFLHITWTKMGQ